MMFPGLAPREQAGLNPAGMMTPEMLLQLLKSKGKGGITEGAIKRRRMGADIPKVSSPR